MRAPVDAVPAAGVEFSVQVPTAATESRIRRSTAARSDVVVEAHVERGGRIRPAAVRPEVEQAAAEPVRVQRSSGGGNDVIRRMPLVGNIVTDTAALIGGGLKSTYDWWSASQGSAATYSPVLSAGGFATGMNVVLPKGKGKVGNGQGPNGGGPAWAALSKKKTPNAGAYYVQLHLLRQKWGGKGDWYNLVPMTNWANNPHGLSHFHRVEKAIDKARVNDAIGYRVTPIYTRGAPFQVAPTVVQQLMGMLSNFPFWQDLTSLMYYEAYVPNALQTSWWKQPPAAPDTQWDMIPNWAPSESRYGFAHMLGPAGNLALTTPQWLVMGAVELLKLLLTVETRMWLWPAVTTLLNTVAGVGIPGVLAMEPMLKWLVSLSELWGSLIPAMLSVGSPNVWAGYNFGPYSGFVTMLGPAIVAAVYALVFGRPFEGFAEGVLGT